jgi:hypothetical protein
MTVCMMTYHFVQVFPRAFLVTAPHKRAATWRAAPGTAGDEAQLARVRRVYALFKERLVSRSAV